MDRMLLVALVICAVCLWWIFARPPVTAEPFLGAGLPPGQGRQAIPDPGFESRLRLAADTGIPLRLGSTTSVPFKYSEVKDAMTCAVALVNKRCQTDFDFLGMDGAAKTQDAVQNVRYTADVHVYSQKYNVSITCNMAVVTNGGRKYLQSVTPQSTVDPEDSGVEAAPADVFVRDYGTVESLV